MPGHVFLAQGDITRLACDAWLLPTDVGGNVTPAWLQADDRLAELLPKLRSRSDELRNSRAALLRPRTQDSPAIVAVDTGGVGAERASWYGDAVRAALRLAVAEVGVTARNARERPLIAMPFVGIGAGGAGEIKGDVLLSILDAAASAVGGAASIDVTLVTLHQRHLQAAQEARRQLEAQSGASWWLELDDERRRLAQRLAQLAKTRQLVLFLGAGVSRGAGLPGWDELLRRLVGDDAKLQSPEFRELDVLDQARLIRKHLGDRTYRQRMQSIFGQRELALSHQLLAGLPVSEAATTNYDTLFEDSWRLVDEQIVVLPGSTSVGASRWLLKLHGTITDPESLVLSRDDYLRFDREGNALSGVVQAMLLTRHMLFVGFSLTDDHFHRIVHDVRAARGAQASGVRFGTTLAPTPAPFIADLWGEDLDVAVLAGHDEHARGARRIEILLDRILAECQTPGAHLLDDSFDALWNDDERRLRERLRKLGELARGPNIGPVRGTIEDFLAELGRDRLR